MKDNKMVQNLQVPKEKQSNAIISVRNLYKKFGFTEVLFDGADENGEYFKLMKSI